MSQMPFSPQHRPPPHRPRLCQSAMQASASADGSVFASMPSTVATDDANQSVTKSAVPLVGEQATFQGQAAEIDKQASSVAASSPVSPAALMVPATQVYYGDGVLAFGSTTYNVQLTKTPAITD
jgi:hypothetical protein